MDPRDASHLFWSVVEWAGPMPWWDTRRQAASLFLVWGLEGNPPL